MWIYCDNGAANYDDGAVDPITQQNIQLITVKMKLTAKSVTKPTTWRCFAAADVCSFPSHINNSLHPRMSHFQLQRHTQLQLSLVTTCNKRLDKKSDFTPLILPAKWAVAAQWLQKHTVTDVGHTVWDFYSNKGLQNTTRRHAFLLLLWDGCQLGL